MKRNILLVFVLIVLSLLLATPFGNLVNPYLFPYSGFSTFSFPDDLSGFLNGLQFVYLILTPIIFNVWGKSKKWLSIVLVSVPAIVISIVASVRYTFWALIFFVVGIILSIILKKIFKLSSIKNLE